MIGIIEGKSLASRVKSSSLDNALEIALHYKTGYHERSETMTLLSLPTKTKPPCRNIRAPKLIHNIWNKTEQRVV